MASTGCRKLELEQVAHANIDGGLAESLARGRDHRRRRVDRDHAPARKALDQRLGDAPRATAGVEYGLLAAQRQPFEHVAAPVPPSCRRCGRNWLRPIARTGIRSYAITYAQRGLSAERRATRIRPAPAGARDAASPASAASRRESCPPCQASARAAGVLDDQPRAWDRRRVALADRQRMAGSASSRLAITTRRGCDRRQLARAARTAASAAPLRARRRPRRDARAPTGAGATPARRSRATAAGTEPRS